jgi:hypothetical protein
MNENVASTAELVIRNNNAPIVSEEKQSGKDKNQPVEVCTLGQEDVPVIPPGLSFRMLPQASTVQWITRSFAVDREFTALQDPD